MAFPDAVAIYLKRCPGVSVQKYISRLPTSTVITPSSHCQLQLPAVDALDTRSLQLVFDVSTMGSTGGPFVMPRYGGQMLIENSTLICGGRSIGGQSNQFYNVWNHIKQEYSAGSTDQPKMSVMAGAGDIPPLGNAAGGYDYNATYTPPGLSTYTNALWAGAAQCTGQTSSGVNQLAKDGTAANNPIYQNGLPQVIDVFNETLESIEPSMLPTFLMQSTYVDLGFAAPACLIGPATGVPTYQICNVTMQGTVYALGQQFRDFHTSYIQAGNIIQCPFKSVQAWPGALSQGMDVQLNFSVASQSIDQLTACFLDSAYRTNGPVVAGTNTSKYFTLGKGTGVRQMSWQINGQSNPSFPVGPKHAWGQTVTDMGLWRAGHGTYKNLNSYAAYLTKWFVWSYSTSMPFAECLTRAISGLNTENSNAQLSLVVQSDPTNTAAAIESYANFPLVFITSTSTLNIGQGGQISVSV